MGVLETIVVNFLLAIKTFLEHYPNFFTFVNVAIAVSGVLLYVLFILIIELKIVKAEKELERLEQISNRINR